MKISNIIPAMSCTALLLSFSSCVEVAKSVHSFNTLMFGEKKEDNRLKELGKDYVMYFFNDGSLYGNNMAIYVKSFSEIHKWKVCEVIKPGCEKSGRFEWTSLDKNLFSKFQISEFPMAFIVHEKGNFAVKVIESDVYEKLSDRVFFFSEIVSPEMLQRRIKEVKNKNAPMLIIDGITWEVSGETEIERAISKYFHRGF